MKRKSTTKRRSGAAGKKTSVAIVGAGNVGRVLALALAAAKYRVIEVGTRKGSRAGAAALARKVGAKVVELEREVGLAADVIWICVPDDAIAEVAKALARSRTEWRGKVVLHTSGAASSRELAVLKRCGAAVGSAHPMNTFVATSKPDFQGVPFAVEGDARAVRTATVLAKSLGADAFRIKPESKVLYHAMGSFASPLLVSLLSAAEKVGKAAGIPQPDKVMRRILRQTIENYLRAGSAAAFSGPILRGDVKTVQSHLKQLRRVSRALDIYKILARNAVENLPGREKRAVQKLLDGAR